MGADRLRVFIDGGYLFHVFAPYRKEGYKYSLQRLARRLSENHVLQKVHYIDAINNRDPAIKKKQEKFYFEYLRDKLGWEVTIHPLQWPGGIAKQKGTDSSLTLQLHSLAVKGEYDTAIIIAADSDYVPAVELAKQEGKVVRNAYFSMRPSYHLQEACNGVPIRLDDIDFIYHKTEPRKLVELVNITLTLVSSREKSDKTNETKK